MRDRIVLGVVALSLAWLYVKVLVVTIGVASAQAPPLWWNQLFTTHASAVITWIVLCQTTAVLTVALPFAYTSARVHTRVGVFPAAGRARVFPSVQYPRKDHHPIRRREVGGHLAGTSLAI